MLNKVRNFGKKMIVAAINHEKRLVFNCKYMLTSKHQIPWTAMDNVADTFREVYADIDQKVTIKRTGGFIVKKYVITICGKDANIGSLPNGTPRKFRVAYTVESLHSIKQLARLINGATAIGMRESGSHTWLKVQDKDGDRYIINKAIVTSVSSRYVTIPNRIDLVSSHFKAPMIVGLKESALCEYAS